MNEKDIQNLIEFAESKIHSGVTHAEALSTFVAAGIMDGNGEYTTPYQELLRETEQQEAYYLMHGQDFQLDFMNVISLSRNSYLKNLL